MYLGSRDGLKAEYFWNKVNNKDNLLMVFKSKSGSIFGAYSPCKWDYSGSANKQDDTLSSFIFSQTHDQIYNLKENNKNQAIHCHINRGPSYGNYNDININGDFTDGYSELGCDYQFDRNNNKNYKTHLYGQEKPEIQECVIYQIQFN
ncbi:unnamed protein product [Paramecium primaurelia]|uniref:TLDc domain-containing protein n=1 Tax=Paramecium primaurelia TaxID=5886 RepID=A0A8S1KVW2_PARPR|nr:unnamed protein product [Paramecium primaurelia]